MLKTKSQLMIITLDKEHFILKQKEDGQLTIYETDLAESEAVLDFSNPQEIQKLFKQDREWKISLAGESIIKYTLIGKLNSCLQKEIKSLKINNK